MPAGALPYDQQAYTYVQLQKLLDNIIDDEEMSMEEKNNLLIKFKKNHIDVFESKFGIGSSVEDVMKILYPEEDNFIEEEIEDSSTSTSSSPPPPTQ